MIHCGISRFCAGVFVNGKRSILCGMKLSGEFKDDMFLGESVLPLEQGSRGNMKNEGGSGNRLY